MNSCRRLRRGYGETFFFQNLRNIRILFIEFPHPKNNRTPRRRKEIMHPRTKELSELILGAMRVVVDAHIVEESFPHVERPSLAEMEFTVKQLINNQPIPEYISVKLESKPTSEMLDDFCKKRNLSWDYDAIAHNYCFRLERFS